MSDDINSMEVNAIPTPTPEDLTRDLAADLDWIEQYNVGFRPEAAELAMAGRAARHWPAALRRAMCAERLATIHHEGNAKGFAEYAETMDGLASRVAELETATGTAYVVERIEEHVGRTLVAVFRTSAAAEQFADVEDAKMSAAASDVTYEVRKLEVKG